MGYILYMIASLADLYTFVIFVYVIMSWIPTRNGIIGDIYNFLGKICDPYLNLFKKIIPPIGGVIDISPILAIIVLQLVIRVLYIIF